jgi:arsenite methyltransferase
MDEREIKKEVREHYAKIVQEAGSCCGPNCGCGPDVEKGISILMNDAYTGTDAAVIAAADLGLGCGTPVDYADLSAGLTVLDLGAGAGIDVFISARIVGPTGRAIGLDMTDEMIARARANRQKLGILNTEFRKGEIEDMPVQSASVDRVVSNCVINLVPDKRRAFAEIFRVLKPGGKFAISDVVSRGEILETYRSDLNLWAGCVSGALDLELYLGLLREAGFKEVSVVKEKPYPLPEGIPFEILSVTVTGTR